MNIADAASVRFDLPDHNSLARLGLGVDSCELALGLKELVIWKAP